MSPTTPKVCTHARGPGTTICLRCRHEERERKREAFARMLLRGTAVVLVAGAVVVAVAGGAISFKRSQDAEAARNAAAPLDSGASTLNPRGPTVNTPVAAPPAGQLPPPANPNPSATSTSPNGVTATPGAPPPAPATPAPAPSPIPFVLAMGRTELSDSVFATRTDNDVRVNFDTQMGRTQRRDRFEVIVRSTLARIYGPKAEVALAQVPQGTLARDGDLLTELPTRGIRLPVPGVGTIVIWPEVRDGRDGPLVVSYRTLVEK